MVKLILILIHYKNNQIIMYHKQKEEMDQYKLNHYNLYLKIYPIIKIHHKVNNKINYKNLINQNPNKMILNYKLINIYKTLMQ